jgi:hypothetical protein
MTKVNLSGSVENEFMKIAQEKGWIVKEAQTPAELRKKFEAYLARTGKPKPAKGEPYDRAFQDYLATVQQPQWLTGQPKTQTFEVEPIDVKVKGRKGKGGKPKYYRSKMVGQVQNVLQTLAKQYPKEILNPGKADNVWGPATAKSYNTLAKKVGLDEVDPSGRRPLSKDMMMHVVQRVAPAMVQKPTVKPKTTAPKAAPKPAPAPKPKAKVPQLGHGEMAPAEMPPGLTPRQQELWRRTKGQVTKPRGGAADDGATKAQQNNEIFKEAVMPLTPQQSSIVKSIMQLRKIDFNTALDYAKTRYPKIFTGEGHPVPDVPDARREALIRKMKEQGVWPEMPEPKIKVPEWAKEKDPYEDMLAKMPKHEPVKIDMDKITQETLKRMQGKAPPAAARPTVHKKWPTAPTKGLKGVEPTGKVVDIKLPTVPGPAKVETGKMPEVKIPDWAKADDGAVVASVVNELVSLANDLEEMGEGEMAVAVDKQTKVYKEAADKLYDVTGETGEDLINQAHPGGGPTLVPAAEEGGKVETIVEEHKKVVDKATKQPTGKYAEVVSKLVATANKLEDEGETEAAKIVDKTIEKLRLAVLPFVNRGSAIEAAGSEDKAASVKKEAQKSMDLEVFKAKWTARLGALINDSVNVASYIDSWGSESAQARKFMKEVKADMSTLSELIEEIDSNTKKVPARVNLKAVPGNFNKWLVMPLKSQTEDFIDEAWGETDEEDYWDFVKRVEKMLPEIYKDAKTVLATLPKEKDPVKDFDWNFKKAQKNLIGTIKKVLKKLDEKPEFFGKDIEGWKKDLNEELGYARNPEGKRSLNDLKLVNRFLYNNILKKVAQTDSSSLEKFADLLSRIKALQKGKAKTKTRRPRGRRGRAPRKKGDPNIIKLQQALMAAGFDVGVYKDDGKWGKDTSAAYNRMLDAAKQYTGGRALRLSPSSPRVAPSAGEIATAERVANFIAGRTKDVLSRVEFDIMGQKFDSRDLESTGAFLEALARAGLIAPDYTKLKKEEAIRIASKNLRILITDLRGNLGNTLRMNFGPGAVTALTNQIRTLWTAFNAKDWTPAKASKPESVERMLGMKGKEGPGKPSGLGGKPDTRPSGLKTKSGGDFDQVYNSAIKIQRFRDLIGSDTRAFVRRAQNKGMNPQQFLMLLDRKIGEIENQLEGMTKKQAKQANRAKEWDELHAFIREFSRWLDRHKRNLNLSYTMPKATPPPKPAAPPKPVAPARPPARPHEAQPNRYVFSEKTMTGDIYWDRMTGDYVMNKPGVGMVALPR